MRNSPPLVANEGVEGGIHQFLHSFIAINHFILDLLKAEYSFYLDILKVLFILMETYMLSILKRILKFIRFLNKIWQVTE